MKKQKVYIGEGGTWDGYLFVQDFIYVLGIKCTILSFAETPQREMYDFFWLEHIKDTKLILIGTL